MWLRKRLREGATNVAERGQDFASIVNEGIWPMKINCTNVCPNCHEGILNPFTRNKVQCPHCLKIMDTNPTVREKETVRPRLCRPKLRCATQQIQTRINTGYSEFSQGRARKEVQKEIVTLRLTLHQAWRLRLPGERLWPEEEWDWGKSAVACCWSICCGRRVRALKGADSASLRANGRQPDFRRPRGRGHLLFGRAARLLMR